ncbi:MAG: hypothetical protein HW388_1645 [Dehalococcoidia bacterium]|nr:hypothetical protein [Dehalococcoidia bacterium]
MHPSAQINPVSEVWTCFVVGSEIIWWFLFGGQEGKG